MWLSVYSTESFVVSMPNETESHIVSHHPQQSHFLCEQTGNSKFISNAWKICTFGYFYQYLAFCLSRSPAHRLIFKPTKTQNLILSTNPINSLAICTTFMFWGTVLCGWCLLDSFSLINEPPEIATIPHTKTTTKVSMYFRGVARNRIQRDILVRTAHTQPKKWVLRE